MDRIETHTVALAHQLQKGLRTLGFDVTTPEGNRSSIVAFKVTKRQDAINTAYRPRCQWPFEPRSRRPLVPR